VKGSSGGSPRKQLGNRVYEWIDGRLNISGLITYMSHKVVPVHGHSAFYYFGGLTLFFFLVQVATGILLLMYYRPGADAAYESVRFIISEVSFGWLIRAIHSWSANLMILMAFLHMFTVYFTQAYRKPREMTWLTGIGLLGLTLILGFSGYLLPWNELSYFATRVGTGMIRAIPILGDYLMVVLRGGEDVTGATIGRFFGLHVAIMPALFSMLLAVHLIFVQRQGMSEPLSWQGKETQKKRYMNFFPNFLYRDLLLWLVALNILALLAVLFPDGIGAIHWHLGEKADPFSPPPEVIRPEWYFGWMFQSLKMLPAHILGFEGEVLGILAIGAAGLVWFVVPFLDREPKPGNKVSIAFIVGGWLALVYMAVATAMVYWPQRG